VGSSSSRRLLVLPSDPGVCTEGVGGAGVLITIGCSGAGDGKFPASWANPFTDLRFVALGRGFDLGDLVAAGEAASMRLVVAGVGMDCGGLAAGMAGVFSEDAGVCLLTTRLGVACGSEGVLLTVAGGV
jgi:hypothetical protein